jgi:hypothetical protein
VLDRQALPLTWRIHKRSGAKRSVELRVPERPYPPRVDDTALAARLHVSGTRCSRQMASGDGYAPKVFTHIGGAVEPELLCKL